VNAVNTPQREHGPDAHILIVGQANLAIRAGLDPTPAFHQCRHMLQAITLVAHERFDMIAVVLAGLDAHLESALTTLRRMAQGTRIVLLATMADEIRARRLVRSVSSPWNVADDYLLCPVTLDELQAAARGSMPIAPDESAATAVPQASPAAVPVEQSPSDVDLRELERLATEDDLTGLKNRRYLREFLRQILEHARRDAFQVTLLVFDIDDFKRYNDTFGHTVGDNVLREAAILMRRCCREHDIVARIGGDEFAVVFWDRPDGRDTHDGPERRGAAEHPRQAYFMAERFRQQINTADLSSLGADGRGTLTISGGLASFPHDADDAETLFQRADQALLAAKRQGKNRILLVGCDTGAPAESGSRMN